VHEVQDHVVPRPARVRLRTREAPAVRRLRAHGVRSPPRLPQEPGAVMSHGSSSRGLTRRRRVQPALRHAAGCTPARPQAEG
jgi:hypothetical protein